MAILIKDREIKGVLTDADGTFYNQDTLTKIFDGVRTTLAVNLLSIKGNSSPTQSEIQEMKNFYLDLATKTGSFNKTFVKLGGDPEFYETTAEHIDKGPYVEPDNEISELIQTISSHARIGILTSTTEESLDTLCAKLFGSDWRILFHAIICSNSPGATERKPHPDAFRFALRQLGTRPEETIMIGDSDSADLQPAARLGMFTIQVETSDSSVANLKVKRFTDISRYLTLD